MDTGTVLDVANDRNRLAHLECGAAKGAPDEPMHALCGHPLLGVDAPPNASRCGTCQGRMEAAGGGYAVLLGVARCDACGGAR